MLKQTIAQAANEGASALVLDLRNIPGGYLTQAVEIASLFIQSGTVVQIKSGDTTTTKTADGAEVTNLLGGGWSTRRPQVLPKCLLLRCKILSVPR